MLIDFNKNIFVVFFLLFFFVIDSNSWAQCGGEWKFKKELTVDKNQVTGGSNLKDFPLLIDITDLNLRTTSNGGNVENINGYDISFIDGSGALLAHELMQYNASTGALLVWVKVPFLYASVDTKIEMIYGNSNVTTDPSSTATWNSGFEAVLHLQESGNGSDDEFKDATINTHDGTGGGLSGSGSASETPTRVAGKFGFSQDFDDSGSQDHIRLDVVNDATWTGVTVEAWVNPDDNGDDRIFGKSWGTGTNNQTWLLRKTGGTGGTRMRTNSNNNTGYDPATLGTGSWQHMAFTWDGSSNELSVYLNGVLEGTTTLNGTTIYTTPTVDEPTIGNTSTLNRGFDGQMQEVRVSQVARSSAWMSAQFNNQDDPSSFYSFGNETAGTFSPMVQGCGYSFLKNITIESDSVKGSGTHTDFPILISLTDSDLATVINGGNVQNSSGFDIIFTDSNLTVLDHQIEEYDPSNGTYSAWVKIPSLPTSTDLPIYMFYGNANVFSDPSTNCVWSSDYQGVWHLHNDFSDGSGTGNNGTNNGSVDSTSGISGDCQSFDGSNDYIQLGVSGFGDNDDNQTISIWAQFSVTPSGSQNFTSVTNNGSSSGTQIGYRSGNSVTWKFGGTILANSGGSESNNNWHYYVYTFDGTTNRFYVDGKTPSTSTTSPQNGTPDDAEIGRWTGGTEYFSGLIDELRYSTNVKSDGWIATEYTNIINTSSFYTVGSEIALDISSNQSGDWDLTTTWVGGIVPGFGSNLTILHDVDLDDRNEFICNMIISNSNNSNSSFEMQNARTLEVKENVSIEAIGSNDVTLQVDDDNSKMIIYGDLLVYQDNGDDVLININNAGDSLIVKGNFIMEHDGGDNMEVQMDNATGVFLVFGYCTANMNSGSGDRWEFDLNAGEFIIQGNLIAKRQGTFGDLEFDLDGGNFTVDSLSLSSSGGGGSDQIIITVDQASQFTTNKGMYMGMGGGDDHQIYLNNNGGTAGVFTVNGDFLWEKTGGDDALILVDDANSEFHVTGDFTINSSAAEEIFINLDNGEFNIDGTFTIKDTKNNTNICRVDMDGCVMTVGDSIIALHFGDANSDVHFDLDGTSIINTGTFIGTLTGLSGSEELLIDIDNSAQINVTNDMVLQINTGNDLEFHLGQNTGGSTAQLNVGGNLTLDHNGAVGADDIQFIINDNSAVNISGIFTMETDGSAGGSGNFYTRLNDDVVLNVDSNIVMDNNTGSGYLEIEMNNNSKIEIGGNFVRNTSPNNYGLVSSSTSTTTIEYNGNTAQIFADEDGAGSDGIEYELVIINNTFGSEPQLTLEDDVTLTNNIDFLDGVLLTTPTEILSISDNATTNGGSLGSFVDGPIRKVGNDAFEFPVGNAGIWSRISMSSPFNVSTIFEAEFERSNPHFASYDTSSKEISINNISSKDYWILDKISAGADSVLVTLHWENADVNKINDLNDLKVVRWDSDSSKWFDHSQSATTGGANPTDSGTITSDFRIQKFSPFTFGSGSSTLNPLPISLLYFRAKVLGDVVDLKWVTVSEINNDFFTIERSSNLKNWEEISTIRGAGNTNAEISYDEVDRKPLNGTSYYRLKQTDFNGAFSYSNIEAVSFNDALSFEIVRIFPNPSSGKVTVILNSDVTRDVEYLIVGINGEIISKKRDKLEEGITLIDMDFSFLSAGVYNFIVVSNTQQLSKKLLIK